MNVDLTGANWTTGRSSGTGQCVEVAIELPAMPGHVAVRDSKDRDRAALVFTDAEWAAHLASVRDGLYDKQPQRPSPTLSTS
ncbi:DUF397 domain-containing protein [Actinoplanes sp. NPDC051343]|uniref:DUF397 domain-containing protein n=1 Tax=Actinoplanes sp. NPDC051343 TaxID=3363906 RepID=UPI00378D94A7